MTGLCRDCLVLLEQPPPEGRCPACGERRLVSHPELATLSIAHIDCDAFYANVEKRDDPALRDRPVLVGGGRRGVVSAACYVARLYGVHSAMPMFKALKACPEAVVIRPDMAKYQRIGRAIRDMMRSLTPLVEPLSIDEAFLDLTGTEALHKGPPAMSLARLALAIEREHGLTVSIGLSYNKFLAKVASDLDKPRGLAVIGRAKAEAFLAEQPVKLIWGVGKALQRTLARDGILKIGDLRAFEEDELTLRYGAMGRRLYNFSRGRDKRRVDPESPTKSISSETTFNEDLCDLASLSGALWPLCETVGRRLKKAELAGTTVTLKLKTADFRILTRSRRLGDPTQLAEELYRTANGLLEREADGRRFRLIGVGASDLTEGALADPPDLLEPDRERRAKVEGVIDQVREKLGRDAIMKGRGLRRKKPESSTPTGAKPSGSPARR